MDILDEVSKHIPERGIVIDTVDDDTTSLIDTPLSLEKITLSNITTNDDGDLIHAPWVSKSIGDMTVEELEVHLGSDVDVSSVIENMQTHIATPTGKIRKLKIPNKKRKAKNTMAKASRKRNRK